LPTELTDATINALLAKMSDDQVRGLLTGQLKDQARTKVQASPQAGDGGTFIDAVGVSVP
jgi:hypothetical protein